MQKRKWKSVLALLMMCVGLILASSTLTSAQSSNDTANTAQQTQPVDPWRLLDKTLAEVEALERVVTALKAQVEAERSRAESATQLAAARAQIAEILTEQNRTLRAMKCSKTSFLFGLVSKKECY